MKKVLLILMVMVMAATLYADTTKVCYIITATDTTVRNANVDSVRAGIVNDPMGQLPGIWKVDLCCVADAETQPSSFWADYDLIITWGVEENGSRTNYKTSLDQILDTIHKPVIARDAYICNGDPMWLGTAVRAASIDRFRLTDASHFITKTTYTDNYHFGDTVWLYTATTRDGDVLRGMANNVATLVNWQAEGNLADGDSGLVVTLESNATNASGGTSPHRRAYFGLLTNYQYSSTAAKVLWYRTLRWALGDAGIDTCVTQAKICREGIDGSWMEYSGATCQMWWHYGGFGTIYTGWDVQDRVGLIRARTTAINTVLPDTNSSWAYDITNVTLVAKINGIDESNPANSFSFWEALFGLNYDTLWLDYKTSIQLDSTCASYLSAEEHRLSNSGYLKYPTIPWNSARASTRGTDYLTNPYDSVWVQDPILEQQLVFSNLLTPFLDWMADSQTNQGVITHTTGTVTNDAELKLYSENAVGSFQSVNAGPTFTATLVWRAANGAAPDLDSSIRFSPDSVEFSAYVNGADPNNQILQVYNGSSSATFTCGTTAESPAVDWLAIQTNIGNGETPFYLSLNPTIDGLAAGYYSTWIKNTCASVSDSPDSAKVILRMNPVATRPTGGKLKF